MLGEVTKFACSSHTSDTNVAPIKLINSTPENTLNINGKLIPLSFLLVFKNL
jgi:hypothetical protein